MKKLLGIVVLCLLLVGCSHEVVEKLPGGKEFTTKKLFSDDPNFLECSFDENWYNNAVSSRVPSDAITKCYKELSVQKICLVWDYVYEIYIAEDSPNNIYKLRNSLSDALVLNNQDPLVCRKGDNDDRARYEASLKKLKRKLNDAESRAANAESRAANAESRASQAESEASYWRSQSNY